MSVIGIDGCKAGWFFVELREADHRFGLTQSLQGLLRERHPSLLLIDIPIGLRQDGELERLCDKEARRLLGKRGSSVFPAPCRAAAQLHHDYVLAKQRNRELTGRGLTKQSHAICKKIFEVDELMTTDPAARAVVREVHPEVLFWGLAGGKPMQHAKRTRDGFAERLALLNKHVPAEDLAREARAAYRRSELANDDILDALAAAVVAAQGSRSLHTLPEQPEWDEKGLPMEMVYCLRPSVRHTKTERMTVAFP